MPNKNHLSIYLVKDTYSDEDSIVKGYPGEIKKVDLADDKWLYYVESHIETPTWLSTFFLNNDKLSTAELKNSSVQALLVVKITSNNKDVHFAIPFGHGRFLIKDDAIVERFGLITTLNMIEPQNIRALDKKTLSTNPIISREQIARASRVSDFGINYESDLLQSMTGKSSDSDFGSILSGRDSLALSAEVDIGNIAEVLKKSWKNFKKTDYKSEFDWIDNIKEIKEQTLIDRLDALLLSKIRNKDELVFLSIPEVLDWSNVDGFKFSGRRNDANKYDEPFISDYIEGLEDNTALSLDDLKKHEITCWAKDAETVTHRWRIYKCINAEVDYYKKKYFLDSGKWYQISKNFVEQVEEEIAGVGASNLNFPDYDTTTLTENAYNKKVEIDLHALCLDTEVIQYGGGKSSFEVCDILTKDKHFIHVKKYSGSAVLSHLFNQGLNSALLFISEEEFRRKVRDELLSPPYKPIVPIQRPEASKYNIVYAIIKKNKNAFHMPFFSKVSFRNAIRILKAYGYNVYLDIIENNS